MGRIAVTGTSSFLGARILRRLVDARGADSVVTVDIAAPPAALGGVRHQMLDLTLPGADQRLVDPTPTSWSRSALSTSWPRRRRPGSATS
ncbi:MAG: hypothetical protein DMF79_11570 [Acidobacteria bacterium]|nr:MAG: hypothetical protein DMF79_11570 [Acidobacteriota bacterium]